MNDRLRTRLDAGRQDGFTLIELLIVIVILGVLAGIVVFAVGTARGDSIKSACKADIKTVNTAAEAFKAKNSSGYPATMAAMVPDFMKSVPNGGTDYTISYAGGTASGTITSGGAAC